MGVHLLELPAEGLSAAHDERPLEARLLTVVRLEDSEGRVGWGECSALNQIGYSSESAATAFELLSEHPGLSVPGEGSRLLADAPMAMAAVEMAELDLRLSAMEVSLAEYLGVGRTKVPAGAVIPLGSIEESVRLSLEAASAGFLRIKLKVVPEERSGISAARIVAAIVEAAPGVEIQLDANGSFDQATRSELVSALEAGARVLEQPFPADEVALAAEFVAQGVTVLVDEAATGQAAIQHLVSVGACSGVVIKPSRLGGLFNAFETLAWCEEVGVPAAAGGMQESGLGRSALAVVAAHDACSITGDVSPARRWLRADPWTDVEMTDGMIAVPHGPGVAPPPDPELIGRFSIRDAQRKLGQA